MTTHQQPKSTLQSLITAHLHVESDMYDGLVEWCRECEGKSTRTIEFKEQLRAVVEKPGSITPQIYERWTGDETLETQAAVDQRLKDLWNACFPDESRS